MCYSKRNSDKKSKQKEPMKWACTSECKTITTQDTEVIVSLKEDFDKPMNELRHVLETCDDGCPNGHYTVNLVSVIHLLMPLTLKGIHWFVPYMMAVVTVNLEF